MKDLKGLMWDAPPYTRVLDRDSDGEYYPSSGLFV